MSVEPFLQISMFLVGARCLARLSWGALGAFFSALAGFYRLGGAVALRCSAHSPRENRAAECP
jgi:hypothetical protein